jgi:hypothetical protein
MKLRTLYNLGRFFGVKVEAENADLIHAYRSGALPLIVASPRHRLLSDFDSSPSAASEESSLKQDRQSSLGVYDEGQAEDLADAVHLLLAEWTTLFDD